MSTKESNPSAEDLRDQLARAELRAQFERAQERLDLETSLAKAKAAHQAKPTEKTKADLHAAKGALRAARSEYRTTTREG
jgi:hypothetical protein